MISYLKGTVLAKKDRYLIVAVDAVGYRVYTVPVIIEHVALHEEIVLYIYTYVREDALELYGFSTLEELDFFERLISITGIGPRIALGVLSVASLADIKKAIIHGDPSILQKVSSIGKKTAERIIVELKDKISVTEQEVGLTITENVQLFEALAALGYKEKDIRRVLQRLSPDTKELSERIKEALKILSKS